MDVGDITILVFAFMNMPTLKEDYFVFKLHTVYRVLGRSQSLHSNYKTEKEQLGVWWNTSFSYLCLVSIEGKSFGSRLHKIRDATVNAFLLNWEALSG